MLLLHSFICQALCLAEKIWLRYVVHNLSSHSTDNSRWESLLENSKMLHMYKELPSLKVYKEYL